MRRLRQVDHFAISDILKSLVLVVALAFQVGRVEAQTPASIVDTVSPGITTTAITNSLIYARGYYKIGDSGGGYFTLQSGQCKLVVSGVTYTAGTVINLPTSSGITSGTLVTGAGIPASDTVAAVNPTTGEILLTNAGSGGTNVTLTFGGSGSPLVDGGSVVADSSYNCWQRQSPTGDLRQWGAHIDWTSNCSPYPSSGAPTCHDDTVAMQNWLNFTNAPHNMPPGKALITATLSCPSDVAIQGSPSPASATGTVGGTPKSQIYAFSSSTYGGFAGPAMLSMSDYCGIHSLALLADETGAFDVVDATGGNDLIDQHSLLSGGAYNLNANSQGKNLEIYDSALENSCYDNVLISGGKSNVKLVRNSFAAAGLAFAVGTTCAASTGQTGNNISFYVTDALISDNFIQNGCSNGIYLSTARDVRVSGNFFNDNGQCANPGGAYALAVNSSVNLAVAGNTFQNSAAINQGSPTPSAHVYFSGIDDNLAFAGNVYRAGVQEQGTTGIGGFPNSVPRSIAIHPDYVFDALSGSTITNFSGGGPLAPQNIGVYSPTAASAIGNISAVPSNLITGLALSAPGGGTSVTVAPGQASDSTNSANIALLSGCTVDLGTQGLNGLDVGNPAANTTYYIFAIANAGGANPGCFASTSTAPNFVLHAPLPLLSVTANQNNAFPILWNVGGVTNGSASQMSTNPLGGMSIGNQVTGAQGIQAGSVITSLQPLYLPTTGTVSGSTITGIGSLANVQNQMLVSGQGIQAATQVTAMNVGCSPTPCITMSNAATSSGTVNIAFTGNYTITLNKNSTVHQAQGTIQVADVIYRTIGVVTLDSSAHFPCLNQDEETIYFCAPIQYSSGSLTGGIAKLLRMDALPSGLVTQANVYCVSSGTTAKVLFYSPSQPTPNTPSAFTSSPGYSLSGTGAITAYPAAIYTDTTQHIQVLSDTGGAIGLCELAGYKWGRAK